MEHEARKHPRTRVDSMVVRYQTATKGQFVEEALFDVSDGGTFVQSEEPLAPGTLLRFELLIGARTRPMHGVGRVVWKRAHGANGTPSGMGIKFIKIDNASRAVIAELSSSD